MKCTTTNQELETLIQSGETLGEPEFISNGSAPYEVYPVIPRESDTTGNTVLWRVPKWTEPISVIGQLAMNMRVVAGGGEIVVYGINGDRRIHHISPGMGGVAIREGETYQILSASHDAPLVVRDRAEPPYRLGDEISLAVARDTEIRLHTDATYLIWNPRRPGEGETAGAWWLVLLDEHDTTDYNRARAGQAKFRGDPPHWHAAAQRVGQQNVWPVNVRKLDGRLDVVPHKQAVNAVAGNIPVFRIQEDALIFKAIQDTTD